MTRHRDEIRARARLEALAQAKGFRDRVGQCGIVLTTQRCRRPEDGTGALCTISWVSEARKIRGALWWRLRGADDEWLGSAEWHATLGGGQLTVYGPPFSAAGPKPRRAGGRAPRQSVDLTRADWDRFFAAVGVVLGVDETPLALIRAEIKQQFRDTGAVAAIDRKLD